MSLSVLERSRRGDVAVDLGTSKTVIYVHGEGVVYDQPSILALRTRKTGHHEVIAIGDEAKRMLGREPKCIRTVRPLHGGVIEQLDLVQLMLASIGKQVGIKKGLRRPYVLVGAPFAISPIERRAVRDAGSALGARDVEVIEEPLFSAIGAGVDITESLANMIVDMGGGITEVVVICLGGIVHSESVRVGGDTINQDLITCLRRRHSLIIGDQTAERLKSALCDVSSEKELVVNGTDVTSRMPQSRRVSFDDMRAGIAGTMAMIIDTIKRAFEQTPPMLAGDLVDRGIVLAGGGALLPGFAEALAREVGVSVSVTNEPVNAVIRGGGRVIERRRAR